MTRPRGHSCRSRSAPPGEGSAVGIYDDYEAKNGRSYLLGLHCRIMGQESHWYLRPDHDRSYTVYRIDRMRPAEA